MFAQLTPDQSAEAWKVFLNLGAVGVIAFAALSFVAMVIWTLWVVLRRLARKYLPELFEETINTLRSVREFQEGIAKNQELSVANLKELIRLSATSVERDNDIKEILRVKLDPSGHGFKNHTFSSARIEEFLGLSLDLLEEWLEKDSDMALKLDWRAHIVAMRKSLQSHQKMPDSQS